MGQWVTNAMGQMVHGSPMLTHGPLCSGYKDGSNYPRYKVPQDEQLAAKQWRS